MRTGQSAFFLFLRDFWVLRLLSLNAELSQLFWLITVIQVIADLRYRRKPSFGSRGNGGRWCRGAGQRGKSGSVLCHWGNIPAPKPWMWEAFRHAMLEQKQNNGYMLQSRKRFSAYLVRHCTWICSWQPSKASARFLWITAGNPSLAKLAASCKLLLLISTTIHSWHVALLSTVFGKKLCVMNLLVTFRVNFPQQEECLSSPGQHTCTEPLSRCPLGLHHLSREEAVRLLPDMHWPRKGKQWQFTWRK